MLDFIKELLASLKKTSTERISNPFYGVFIFTWLAFNWEAVAIIFFSDLPMQERVRFINSAYPLMYILPFISAVILTLVLPWCTEKVTYFQSRFLSRTSSLLAIRRKKMLIADISVERFRAKKDVTYDRHKVNAQKEIQDMKEAIITSTERTGELTKELDDAKITIEILNRKIFSEKSALDEALRRNNVDSLQSLENNNSIIANNLNIATQENIKLIEQNNFLNQKLSELGDVKKNLNLTISELSKERSENGRLKNEASNLFSENKTLHIENSDLKSELMELKNVRN
ncbi:hypothetical protein [Pantoea sp.]|uniref:coiled-coil domain-containing protein n=1 Tax=Pantoea sp. TaxID=69393 RepID=UPI0028A70205|nr:hypothetical protein [Pantoea sp.]